MKGSSRSLSSCYMFKNTRQKNIFVRLHRYLGLSTAVFLIIAGATGSVLAFYHELDEWLNPDLFYIDARNEAVLSAFEIHHKAQQFAAQYGGNITTYVLDIRPNKNVYFRVAGSEEFDQLFINPYDASVVGHRYWGDLSDGVKNLAGFIYRLHYTLFIPDSIGKTFLGIIAFLWTLDCFVSLATTFPIRRMADERLSLCLSLRMFFQRWKKTFSMRWHTKGLSFHYLLHRSAGLWLWFILFVFAWSSVNFNLPQVYKPVMNALFEFPATIAASSEEKREKISVEKALVFAREYAQRVTTVEGISSGYERLIRYKKKTHSYQYVFHSGRDVDENVARSIIYIDAGNGAFKQVIWPTGDKLGHTLTHWLYGLHMAEVFSWPYKIFVCFLGLVIAYFSYSGLLIWWNKRKKLRHKNLAE